MDVSLRPVTAADGPSLERWAVFAAAYMSRTRPLAAGADRHDPDSGLYWYVITEHGRDLGSVWIELPRGAGEAVLGVFLGDPSSCGRGLGRAAIALALAEFRDRHPNLAVTLRVRRTNARAIACYRHLGFTITGRDSKSLPSGELVPYYCMVLPAW